MMKCPKCHGDNTQGEAASNTALVRWYCDDCLYAWDAMLPFFGSATDAQWLEWMQYLNQKMCSVFYSPMLKPLKPRGYRK